MLVGTKRTEGEAAVADTGTPFAKVAVIAVAESMTAEVDSTPEKRTMAS